MNIWAAVIVLWSTGAYGIVDAQDIRSCQALADEMARQNKAQTEQCRKIEDKHDLTSHGKLERMKKLVVIWSAE